MSKEQDLVRVLEDKVRKIYTGQEQPNVVSKNDGEVVENTLIASIE